MDHPEDVEGLVWVDPSTEDGLFTMFQGRSVTIASLTAEQLLTTLRTSSSIPIPRRSPQTGAPVDRLPPALYQLRIKRDQRLIASFPSSMAADIVRESSEGERAALSETAQRPERAEQFDALYPGGRPDKRTGYDR
jgi:hypothetical protein